MSVKLLTEHHFGFQSLKGGCTGLSESYTCQNATLLEITCHGSHHNKACNKGTALYIDPSAEITSREVSFGWVMVIGRTFTNEPPFKLMMFSQ